ncbi:ABC-type sugar transport systems, permease component [Pyrobaculum oguniense TE7]|uniref:ABC-type sugar transport systems, permease component n=1 Tax=Pyrobaculum oguniense (strain DSM 13380 / JCM 10595 / TE7) TaxID=698757 RepID=H6QCL1_PYROT|nr:ABC-type sugar transport systems, permease component [Pyrobaculum oguniense TE7]
MIRWVLASPGLIALGLFIVGIIYTVALSLHYYKVAVGPPKFVGWDNYFQLFSDPTFSKALAVTVTFVATAALLETAIGVALAYGLMWTRRRGVYVGLLTIPYLVPSVTYVVFWRYMLDYRRGALAPVAEFFGFRIPDFLGNPDTALWAIVGLDVLQLTPFVTLVVFAGLLAVPPEVISAARIDGARGFSMALRVVLPLASSAILAALFLRLIDAFRIFVKVWLLTRGGPGDSTTTLELYLYTRGIYTLDLGLASAVSVVLLGISMAAIVPYVYLVAKTWRA